MIFGEGRSRGRLEADVEERVLCHLTGTDASAFECPRGPAVVAARDLTPTDTATIGSENVGRR